MPTRLAAFVVLFLASGIVGGSIAIAGEPTPEPTGTAEPTPGLAANQLVVRVIEDVNGDGLPQEGEPPLNGVQINGGCSDGISTYTTSVDGSAVVFNNACFRVERRFGWLPTTPASVQLPEDYDHSRILYFMMQDFGDQVMEVQGEAIIAGLPAVDPTFSRQAAPFGECAYTYYEAYEVITPVTVIVVGSPQRSDCPAVGDEFAIMMRDAPSPPIVFQSGATVDGTFVASGDSMRIYANDIDSVSVADFETATINHDCGAIVPLTGFVPQGSVRVFVLSDEVRSGCGASGRRVLFMRRGKPLDPTLQWEAGTPQFSPPLVFTERIEPPTTGDNQISPPETGSGGYRR
jgi:hypothetical protein